MTEKEYLETLDELGKVVYDALYPLEMQNAILGPWDIAREQTKNRHIVAGQAAAIHALTPLNKFRIRLIEKRSKQGLNGIEEALFQNIQDIHSQCLDRIHPRAPTSEFSDYIKSLIKEMEDEEKP